MEVTSSLKHAICGLFEVYADEDGCQRVVTPLEYSGMNDRIVVRVRPVGAGVQIDENGEAAFFASLNGGDIEVEAVSRWQEEQSQASPARFDSRSETISAYTEDERLVAPYIFRVAEAAQQLYTLATARQERSANDFRERVKSVIREIGSELGVDVKTDVPLPIVGAMKADAILETPKPLIVIVATSATRLLEAEVIHMQYKAENRAGRILAVVESQSAVGKTQFERAPYFTHKAVVYNEGAFRGMLQAEARDM